MNERIKQLWDDAALMAGDESKTWDGQVAFMALFAELIVKECAGQCLSDDCMRILNHFGVEESKGWVCSKCGIDRTKEVCPLGHSAALEGRCPMVLSAQ